jgi:hypothetical protein
MSIIHDPQEVEKTLRLVCRGQLTEIRALNASFNSNGYRPGVISGYFNDYPKAVLELSRIVSATGIYFVLNPIAPWLLAKANNRLIMAGNGDATSDNDIIRRCWLPIDIDRRHSGGVSASNGQKKVLEQVASAVRKYLLEEQGFPPPICADSGNGYHMLFSLPESSMDDNVVKQILKALADRFDTEYAKIDQSVHNLSRIWKLYGTLARKRDEVPELGIYHRQAKLLHVPELIAPVDIGKLHALAAQAQPIPVTASPAATTNNPAASSTPIQAKDGFDWLDQWLARYFPEAGAPEPWDAVAGGRIWKVDCPWQPHHGQKARITQHPNGAISAGCFKGSCSEHHWHSLRDLKEPGWRQKKMDAMEPWPEPIPLKRQGVAPMDELLIPEPLRPFLLDIADRMQVPVDFPAVAIIALISSLIGRKAAVFPRMNDNSWYEVASLWALMVGSPGVKKTPSLQAVMTYAYAEQKRENNAYQPLFQQYQADLQSHETRISATKKQLEKAVLAGKQQDQDAAKQTLDQLHQTPPTKPPLRRYFVQDATVEKLQEILGENPNGSLLELTH